MNKQKQIEEMAKEIEKAKKHIWASVMPQADYEDYLWHSRAIAEHLMLQGYRKLPEDAVVLTKEEYIDLSRNYVREQIEQTRKGTAKEIVERLRKYDSYFDDYKFDSLLDDIELDYGVEVENDG